jgi:hypothetical protein
MNKLISIASLFCVILASSALANANALSSLENLERERAALLQNLTSVKVDAAMRQQQSNQQKRRLADIERMVLRDDRIASSDSVMAQKAFASYELTFLVHAGAETEKLTIDHWLTELNITSGNILTSKAGSR